MGVALNIPKWVHAGRCTVSSRWKERETFSQNTDESEDERQSPLGFRPTLQDIVQILPDWEHLSTLNRLSDIMFLSMVGFFGFLAAWLRVPSKYRSRRLQRSSVTACNYFMDEYCVVQRSLVGANWKLVIHR